MDDYPGNRPRSDTSPADITSTILKIMHPEKIICYGRRVCEWDVWSPFILLDETSPYVTYDLLVITRENEKRSRHEITDMLDSCLTGGSVRATVIVHGIKAVNEALLNGSHFFYDVCQSGLILYDNSETALLSCGRRAATTDIPSIEQVWRAGFELAQQFLNGASYFSSSGCDNIAAFMLHQAVEHTCTALVRLITGYRPATHNLNRLLALTENFSPMSLIVFPRNTPEERDLFNLLARAYSDVRYKEGFKVPRLKTPLLIERVSRLQYYAKKLYEDKTHQAVNRYREEISTY